MILLLGAGRQGFVVLETLKELGVNEVEVLEKDSVNAVRVRDLGFNVIEKSIDEIDLASFFKNYTVVVDCLPARFGFNVLKSAAEAGVDIVDITYMEEDPLALDNLAKKNGVTALVDAGFAPGLSNLFVGMGVREFKEVERVVVRVGGIPLYPEPPLNYRITWSFEDLLEEYTRPARIKVDGKITEIPALSGLDIDEYFVDGRMWELESFYTDGLRSLLYTIDVEDMEERTIRYPGHAYLFESFIKLGLLNKNNPIYPAFSKFLYERMSQGKEEDVAILEVLFFGEESEEEDNLLGGFYLVHHYNRRRKRTAMSELTGIPPALLTKMIVDGKIKQKGIIPLELIEGRDLIEEFLGMLEDFGIKVWRFSEEG